MHKRKKRVSFPSSTPVSYKICINLAKTRSGFQFSEVFSVPSITGRLDSALLAQTWDNTNSPGSFPTNRCPEWTFQITNQRCLLSTRHFFGFWGLFPSLLKDSIGGGSGWDLKATWPTGRPQPLWLPLSILADTVRKIPAVLLEPSMLRAP